MKELIEIARDTHRENPTLLQTNVVSTVFAYLKLVKQNAEKEGYKASFVGKTRGESQYTPPEWTPVVVQGFELTGVSHDALWVHGKQYDFVGSANDEDHKIFDAEGKHIVASPVANAIDPKWWRQNNPPVDLSGVETFEPKLQPVPVKAYPGDHVGPLVANDLFADYKEKGEAPNPGMGVWLWRVSWMIAQEGKTPEEAVSIQRHGPQGWRKALEL